MNNDLFERVLIQLQPELAQEFGYAILEDKKKLKALEIIKEKRVNVDNFLRHIKKDTDYKEYKRLCGLYKIMVFSDEELTQEEYELLKEVLL